ncbi:alanine racemase [Clostridium massiliamazoniense]|uniref:alanine racemase n=1 Tax=Clostridium massiliamazoniense TaxID=1347366 RepID=UPI0006D7C321|nr:alanine racemase [Clostridium massiliamazoniense]
MDSIRPVWAEINLNNLKNNIKAIKSKVGDKEIIATVKANAYGHGAVDVAPVLLENGATRLAVAVITEALELRRAKISAPIIILGFTPLDFSKEIITNEIEQTVYNYEYAKNLSDEAIKLNSKAKVHIALDTGMGRIGFLPNEESIEEIKKIFKLPGIKVEGIFTHFATSDEADKEYSMMQYEKFKYVCNAIEETGIKIPLKHVSNSAAIIDLEETYLDAVRPGIILYGYYPSEEVKKDLIKIKPVLTLKAKIANLKTLHKDMYISYGRTFKTERESKIGTLPIGYADGYSRSLTGTGKVLVNGKFAPVVGKICMDQCMIDLTDIEDIKLGDEVILLGEDSNIKMDADDIAELLGTISYEVLCMIKNRVPRVYINDGKIIKIKNYL